MRGQQQRSCASGVPTALRYLAGTAICAVRPQLLRQLRRRHHLETLGFSEATVDHGGTFVARAWGEHPVPSRGEARRPLCPGVRPCTCRGLREPSLHPGRGHALRRRERRLFFVICIGSIHVRQAHLATRTQWYYKGMLLESTQQHRVRGWRLQHKGALIQNRKFICTCCEQKQKDCNQWASGRHGICNCIGISINLGDMVSVGTITSTSISATASAGQVAIVSAIIGSSSSI